MVAIRRDSLCAKFKFPAPIGKPIRLRHFLQASTKGDVRSTAKPGSHIAKNIKHFAQKHGDGIFGKWCVIDAHAGLSSDT